MAKAEEHFHDYEMHVYEMISWILERTWGGHEKHCPLFAVNGGDEEKCECINKTIKGMYKAIKRRVYDNDANPISLAPRLMDLQAELDGAKAERDTLRAELEAIYSQMGEK